MDTTPGIIESLFEKAEAYFITTLELTKLKAIQTINTAMSALAVKLALIILISILAIILSIGAGLWLGDILGELYYGFFAVSGLYLVLIISLQLFLQKWLKRKISDSILKHLL
jgi:hypothetical protein